MSFPIIADDSHAVANLYDMIHPNANATMTVRSVFIIGPDKKVKLMMTYPSSVGRNFHEVLRTIDSLQLSAQFPVATPAEWNNGDDVIIMTSVTNEQAKTQFPKGFKEVTPYLRTTPQPNN
jgi:alkyl hydroperoxide reductase subunit AhpC